MSTYTSLLHKLSSSEFCPLFTSRFKTRFYFQDHPVDRYEVQEMRRINFFFFKSSTVIFITISAWCQSLWILQYNGFRKWLQILQPDWIKENCFSKFPSKVISPYYAKRACCITSRLLQPFHDRGRYHIEQINSLVSIWHRPPSWKG